MAFQDTVRRYAIALAETGYVSYCFDFCGGHVLSACSENGSAASTGNFPVKNTESESDTSLSETESDLRTDGNRTKAETSDEGGQRENSGTDEADETAAATGAADGAEREEESMTEGGTGYYGTVSTDRLSLKNIRTGNAVSASIMSLSVRA